jgi:hypothetical protein
LQEERGRRKEKEKGLRKGRIKKKNKKGEGIQWKNGHKEKGKTRERRRKGIEERKKNK